MIKEKHSHINADEEQKRYFEIEKKYEKNNRALNIALTAAFFAFIYVFAILFWALPDKDVSVEENRSLAAAPEFSFKTLADGSYTADFATYMADQFPARNFFVGMKAQAERLTLRGGNNGVIFADDGYLVKRFDSPDEETYRKNVGYICDFAAFAKSEGIDVTIGIAGRTLDVAQSVLPSVYGTDSSDKTWSIIESAFKDNGTAFADLKTPLKERFDAGEYVYYKTDHHWTTLGAFYAYTELARAAGIDPAPRDLFRRDTVSDSFFGTTWSSAGAKWIGPDELDFFRFDGDESLVTDRGDDGGSFDGLYDVSFLEKKDKYSAFIGGNAARVDVTSNDGEREKILVVKDSFFHSMAPFFAKDYDLIMIDLRYYMDTVPVIDICRNEGVDKVLFMLNAETLGDESGLRTLKIGLTD